MHAGSVHAPRPGPVIRRSSGFCRANETPANVEITDASLGAETVIVSWSEDHPWRSLCPKRFPLLNDDLVPRRSRGKTRGSRCLISLGRRREARRNSIFGLRSIGVYRARASTRRNCRHDGRSVEILRATKHGSLEIFVKPTLATA